MKLQLIQKKECYRLTWFGRLLTMLVVVVIFAFLLFRVPVWLSRSQPVNGQILVLDGVMGEYAIEEAISLFQKSNYDRIVVTGGNFPADSYLIAYKSMAEYSYANFLALNFDSTKIYCLPSGKALSNRTYTSGTVLKHWIQEQNLPFTKIDVLSIGCHSARSKYLFQLALGDQYEVGVISIRNPSYNNSRWWETSQGARVVISETIGFLYAKFIFFP
jgi:hypothetical protein